MHHTIASLIPFAASGVPLASRQTRPLTALLPEHLMDIMALARISTSAAKRTAFSCGIINAKSGRCSENCAFCAQSAHHGTDSPVYPLVKRDQLVAKAEELALAGSRFMGIVISGTSPTASDFDRLLEDAVHIKSKVGIELCASLGLLSEDQALQLKQAGFTSYHHNIETARSHYPAICGTHGFDARVETVRLARLAGLRVCSGGIFGMGESWEQRLEMAETLADLQPHCIPVNFLNPIPGTPLQGQAVLPIAEALGIISILRLMHPDKDIVICGGRTHCLADFDALIFAAGANAIMTGNYLTTSGSPYERDCDMLAALGIVQRPGVTDE